MEWNRHGNKMEALRHYSLIPKAAKKMQGASSGMNNSKLEL
jgi:hypothetical protein